MQHGRMTAGDGTGWWDHCNGATTSRPRCLEIMSALRMEQPNVFVRRRSFCSRRRRRSQALDACGGVRKSYLGTCTPATLQIWLGTCLTGALGGFLRAGCLA